MASNDIGIDLGTTSTLVYVYGEGIKLCEPSVVAINTKTKEVLTFGEDAKKMVGKTPPHISASFPQWHPDAWGKSADAQCCPPAGGKDIFYRSRRRCICTGR